MIIKGDPANRFGGMNFQRTNFSVRGEVRREGRQVLLGTFVNARKK